MRTFSLDSPVQYLKGVGPARAAELGRRGILTAGHLLRILPRRHEDRTVFKPIALLEKGAVGTVQGRVSAIQEVTPRPGLRITRVSVTDGTATLVGVWFNRPQMKTFFKVGARVILSGKVDRFSRELRMANPDYELADGTDGLHAGRLVPIYPSLGRIQPRFMRSLISYVLEHVAGAIPDTVPEEIRRRLGLKDASSAWGSIHFPASHDDLTRARKSLAFEEVFVMQVGLGLLRQRTHRTSGGLVHRPDGPLGRRFLAELPFSLTPAQERVIAEIKRDMESPHPMNRLLQGDVGSGKTVVAAAALLKAVESGYQGAIMAPTEILAEQHYYNLRRLLAPLGVRIALLTGSQRREEREQALFGLSAGNLQIAVGTHALIQEGVVFRALSLAVTDEQHRFGVRQRGLLQVKGAGEAIDVLAMTATPIPRTLALTVYGEMDLSVIDELPPGRKPVTTYWLTSRDRRRAYGFIRRQLAEGRQAYVVCPLVEESEAVEAASATEWVERLKHALPGFRIGLLHGRMRPAEKEGVMAAFRGHELDLLVSTTVIEVGVDVPNANVIVIEGADRFGLAQLHQLRGRVGRGEHSSYCLLIGDPQSEEGRKRLDILTRTTDGFIIAEEDLAIRGPGDFLGTKQHGVPEFVFADPIRDYRLMEYARREAFALLDRDPDLSGPGLEPLREAIRTRFDGLLNDLLIM